MRLAGGGPPHLVRYLIFAVTRLHLTAPQIMHHLVHDSTVHSSIVRARRLTRLSQLCGGEGPGLLDFQDFFGCGWSGGMWGEIGLR